MRLESQWLAGERPIIRVCREWDARRDLCAGCACIREGMPFSMDSPTSLIRAFLGWATDAIPRFTNGREGLENEVREARIGLWAYPQPLPPWEWQKRNR
jgi:hypothetical protein